MNERANDSSRTWRINLYKPSSRALFELSRVYICMSHLIYKKIIVFTNDSFIFQIEIKSSLSEPSLRTVGLI
jgi:hypothetical protein